MRLEPNDALDLFKNLPTIYVDMNKIKKVRGLTKKAILLWESYTNGNVTLDSKSWPFLESIISTSLKVAAKASSSREVSKYAGTLGTALDIVSLGVILQDVFCPFYAKESEAPHHDIALKLGMKSGWSLQHNQVYAQNNKYVESFIKIPPKKMMDEMGITRVSHEHKKSDGGSEEEYIFRIENLKHLLPPRIELVNPSSFMLQIKEVATAWGSTVVHSYYADSQIECRAITKDGKVYGSEFMIDGCELLEKQILPRAFFTSCDFTKGYLEIRGSKMAMRSLHELDSVYTIQNLDVKEMASAALKVLKRGGKRGVALIGDPGVGKTEAGKAIIKHMGNVPVIWLAPECFLNSETINTVFAHIRSVPGAVVFIDDMDSHKTLRDKTSEVTTLIQCMAYKENNFFLIATLNDPRAVESSLLDRGKRFDEVIELTRPGVEEIKYLVEYHMGLYVNTLNVEEVEQLKAAMLQNNFTHVQIFSVFETAEVYSSKALTLDDLMKAVDKVSATSRNAHLTRVRGRLVDESVNLEPDSCS